MRLGEYYRLAKPGLVYGNLIPAAAGFLLASRGSVILFPILVAMLAGLAFVMASGCVFNNYIDRDIDAAMGRTKDRALVARRISGRSALVYGTTLGLIGFFLLALFTNLLAVAAAATGFFFYVLMYSLWSKRRTVHSTLIGSIAGATPPVVGYVAASGRFDLAAALLFLILVVWQMPHFYAIGIRRFGEYAAAGIPILPVKQGIPATKKRMLVYIIIFALIAPLLTVFGYTGFAYLAIAVALCVAWFVLCLSGFRSVGPGTDAFWARRMFLFSLVVMVTLFAAIALGA